VATGEQAAFSSKTAMAAAQAVEQVAQRREPLLDRGRGQSRGDTSIHVATCIGGTAALDCTPALGSNSS
jgi:hypothetical protein